MSESSAQSRCACLFVSRRPGISRNSPRTISSKRTKSSSWQERCTSTTALMMLPLKAEDGFNRAIHVPAPNPSLQIQAAQIAAAIRGKIHMCGENLLRLPERDEITLADFRPSVRAGRRQIVDWPVPLLRTTQRRRSCDSMPS